MPLVRRFAAVAAALALVAFMPAAVLGHSELEQADPAPGATISEAPTLIIADFTEAIDPARSTMELRGPDGAVVATGGVAPGDPERVQMTIVPPTLGPGTYEVRWTTVTPDDNGILRGTYTFTVAIAAVSASPAPSVAPSAPPSAAPSAAPSTEASAALSAPLSAAPSTQPATATPSPSGGGGSSGSSGGPDATVIIAIVAVLAVVGGVAVYLVRGRRT